MAGKTYTPRHKRHRSPRPARPVGAKGSQLHPRHQRHRSPRRARPVPVKQARKPRVCLVCCSAAVTAYQLSQSTAAPVI